MPWPMTVAPTNEAVWRKNHAEKNLCKEKINRHDWEVMEDWEDKAMGQGATRNAGEDYWPWPGRSPVVGPTPICHD